MTTTNKQTVFITGASAGIGKASVQDFAAKGWNVAATMRDPKKGEDLLKLGANVAIFELDVEKQATVDKAVADAIAKFGKIDVLVNNAGSATMGIFESTSIDEQVKKQYEVNVFGVMRVTQALLPHFRANRNGTIVQVSSVVGSISSAAASVYVSSKWALEGWSESLSYELLPFNIQVKLVQPGAFKTEIYNKITFAQPPEGIPEYKALTDGLNAFVSGGYAVLSEPAPLVPAAIYKAATERDATKLRYPVYTDADAFGQLYGLRQEKGVAAQYAAILASTQPQKKEE